MRIMLASPVLKLDDTGTNLEVIISTIKKAQDQKIDLVLFSEAALNGFEGLTFDYQEDLDRTLGLRGPEIAAIQKACRDTGVGAGFGFYQNEGGGFYDSYLIIDGEGELVDLYKRVSPTWKTPEANADYREGQGFKVFEFAGKKFATIICGDLWTDELISDIVDLDPQVDAFFWPVHCDFSLEDWYAENFDYQDEKNLSKYAYAHQSSILVKPVLFINTYVEDEGHAKGGLYVWEMGKTIAEHPMGEPGYLIYELN